MQETLLEFPCVFPLKIMGETREEFPGLIAQIVQQHVPDFDPAQIEIRASSGGKYTGLTCNIRVTCKSQLDDIYRSLTAHPWVKIVL